MPGNDCLILGGGVIGAALALALRERGVGVTVVEREQPRGAWWAAAGMLGAQVEAHQPSPLLPLLLGSRALYGDWVATLARETGVDIAFARAGILATAHDDEVLAELGRRAAWQRTQGLRAELIDARQLAALEPRLTALGALWLPDDAQVDARALVAALTVQGKRLGVVRQHGEVRRLCRHGARVVGAELADGTRLNADTTVVALGAWSSLLDELQIAPEVAPVRGQMLALAGAAVARPVFGGHGYLVPRGDETWVGSTMEHAGFEAEVTLGGLAHLAAVACRLCPALAGASVRATWAGLRPGTRDGLPLLGAAGDGLVLATGHLRNGVLLAPLTAQLLSQAIVDGVAPAALRPFAWPRPLA